MNWLISFYDMNNGKNYLLLFDCSLAEALIVIKENVRVWVLYNTQILDEEEFNEIIEERAATYYKDVFK